MVALLTIEKRRLLAAHGTVTTTDFREAWERCWEIIVLERGWAHRTRYRRSMRQAQDETKDECRAAFLDLPTPFAEAVAGLTKAAARCHLTLEPEQAGKAVLAAICYVEIEDPDLAVSAEVAVRLFMDSAQYDPDLDLIEDLEDEPADSRAQVAA